MTTVKDRSPTAAELAYVVQVQQFAAELRALNSDATLQGAYGPGAAAEMRLAIAPDLRCAHWPEVQLRRGDIISMLTDSWPLAKKGAGLPLFMPGVLKPRNGNALRRRTQPNVEGLHAVVVDYDTGDAPLSLLAGQAGALGLFGVAYRSPSDGSDTTEILRHPGEPGPGVEDIVAPTPDACLAHLIAKGYRADILGPLTIIDPARVVRTKHQFKNRKTGQWETRESINTKIVCRHNSLAKTRLVAFAQEPFQRGPAEPARDFNARWVADMLGPLICALGFYADPSASDVNRCFYFPSALMPSGATEDVARVIPGEPLDRDDARLREWRAAYAEKAQCEREAAAKARAARGAARKGSGTAGTCTGRGHGGSFALADLIATHCDDRVRADKRDDKDGLIECECPFDHLHSNSGDPSDCGFFATNTGYARCHHSHGKSHTPQDFVARMLELGWFDETQLAQYQVRESWKAERPRFNWNF